MKNIFLIIIFLFTNNINSQNINEFYQSDCNTEIIKISPSKKTVIKNTNCQRTSNYYRQDELYIPDNYDESAIHVRCNFIILTKPDGTGNFEENNIEHNQFLQLLITEINNKMANLVNYTGNSPYCVSTPDDEFLTDTRIRYDVNIIYYPDPKWDYTSDSRFTYNVDEPCENQSDIGRYILYPTSNSFYLNTLDEIIKNDSTIPKGINIYFANNGEIYEDLVVNQNYENFLYTQQELDAINCDVSPVPYAHLDTQGFAVSQYPSFYNLDRSSRVFYSDKFLTFEWFKQIVSPTYYQPQYSWEQTKNSLAHIFSRSFSHELGHSLGLSHNECQGDICDGRAYRNCNCCPVSLMNQNNLIRNYLTPLNIGKMHRRLSITNIRNFCTEDSYLNNYIRVTTNEIWDLDWRIYSDVIVESGSELVITCKTIMPPQAQIIVQSGASLILQGGIIESADGEFWEGIKIEGTGNFIILPDTPVINNNYFYAYINSPLGRNQIPEKELLKKTQKLKLIKNKSILEKGIRVYPNPSNESITIKATFEFVKFEIFDSTSYKLVKSSVNKNDSCSVDISRLKKGVYLVKIYSADNVYYTKFVKK